MRRATLMLAIALLSIAALSACQTGTPVAEENAQATAAGTAATGVGPAEQPVTTTARTGAWVDTVVVIEEPNADAGVERLKAGDIDVYAFPISAPATYKKIVDTPGISYKSSYGSFNELTFNPSVCADKAKLNPFSVPRIREAMNYAVDRNYIVSEIMGGLGTARVVPINAASADRGRLAAEIQVLEAKYTFNIDTAKAMVTEEMGKLGAKLEAGKWTFNGKPVELLGLIRSEDERKQIGDYFAGQLESLGFTVVRSYKTSADAAPIWQQSDPTECLFSYYTGGWVSTAVSRDSGSNFNFYYTPKGLSRPLWQAYTPVQAFADLAQRLNDNDFKTLDERKQLFASAMPLALEDSVRIWLLDRSSVAAIRSDIEVASDLSGSIYGSQLWPYTLRRKGEVGGSVTWASASILTEPWNPVAGTNWIYDTALIRATGQSAAVTDPNTGLALPQRIKSLEVTVLEGLPVVKTLDWVTLKTAPTIEVPQDAWVDWDAAKQTFITASETVTKTRTAKMKTVVTYPDDLFQTVKWHDGSPLSMGDMVMSLIMTFDQAKKESKIYDPAQEPALQSFMSTFKGIKIASQQPLTIEYYSDAWQLDAESAAGNLNALWPYYGFGEAGWPAIAIGVMGEEKGLAAFSADKAAEKKIEQFSYIAGPTVQTLTDQLTEATAKATIPYSATLSQYITPEEIKTRYANLGEWFRRRGHYWVGTGPLFLERAYPVEGSVILRRNTEFMDPADRWSQFSEPAIPVVTIDGPPSVKSGDAATFNILVEFNKAPYAAKDLEAVNYLIFDSAGKLATQGTATAAADGKWTVDLDSKATTALPAGSNRLDIVVVSKLVALPGLASLPFVTGQ